MKQIMSSVLALLCYASSQAALSDAKLLNFDAPHRVAGEYYIVFKLGAALAAIPRSGPGSPVLLPNVEPTGETQVRQLATALAKSIGARVGGVIISKAQMAFIIGGASEQKVRDILAKDPRIDVISPGIATTVEGM